jgi:hypothetical protein
VQNESKFSETFTRISSDINNNAMQLIVSTVFLDKTTKAAAKQAKEEFLQKKTRYQEKHCKY